LGTPDGSLTWNRSLVNFLTTVGGRDGSMVFCHMA